MVAVHERSVSVWKDQIKPKVQIAGSGPPVVFLHGAYGLDWDRFWTGWPKISRSTRPSIRHHAGDPDGIKALDNLWDLVLYYDELFEQLGLHNPTLIGHSFGGWSSRDCGLLSAAGRQTRVAESGRPVAGRQPGQELDDPAHGRGVQAAFSDPSSPLAQQLLHVPEDERDAQDAQIRLTWALACTGKFIWPIPDKGLKKRIHRIVSPTLIVWGNDDKLVPPVYAQEFGSRIAGSRIEMIEQAGHLPQLEQLGRVSGLVRDFIQS